MTTGFMPPGSEPFARLMQQAWEGWQSSLRSQTTGMNETGEAQIERTLAGLKNYFMLLESMQVQLGGAQPATAWRDALGGVFGAGLPFTAAFADASQIAGGGPQAWMQSWQQMAAPALSGLRETLSVPGIGLAREHQERAQKQARDVLDYQQQMQRYNQLLARAGRLGTEKFEAKLAERSEPGRQVESLRALYDLWVDAAEEGFQEVALSDEWREVYGALVDAQMRVRAGTQQQVEQVSRELGMPTRSEINTLGQRLHDLRRQVRQLEARLSAPLPRAESAQSPSAQADAGDPPVREPAAQPAGKPARAASKSARKPAAPRRR